MLVCSCSNFDFCSCWSNLVVAFNINSAYVDLVAESLIAFCLGLFKHLVCIFFKIVYSVRKVCSLSVVESILVCSCSNLDFCSCWSNLVVAVNINSAHWYFCSESLIIYCLGICENRVCSLLKIVYCV